VLNVDPALAALVGACDGDLPLGVLIDAIADLLEVDAAALRADLLPRVRELAFTISNSSGGTLEAGIDTLHIGFRAVDSDGIDAEIPYQITAPGVVTWSANPPFSGTITLTVSGTVLENIA
jgi:hypothetical protein